MMNPILPASTGGGTDPALEGRVDALESGFAGLSDRTSAVESQNEVIASVVSEMHENAIVPLQQSVSDMNGQISELQAATERADEEIAIQRDIRFSLVYENRSDFTTAWLFGQASNWLSHNTKLADLGVSERDYIFQVNGNDHAIQFASTDTMNDVLMKFQDIAWMNGVSYIVELFGGQMRFEISGGDQISFPTPGFPDFQHLWYVLGVAGQSATSSAVEVPFSLRDTDVWTSQGTVDKQIQRLSTEARAAANAAARSANLPLLEQPQIVHTGYIFPDNTGNLLSENTDLSAYLVETDTLEMKVDGVPYSIPAGSILDVSNIVANLNMAGVPDCYFEYFGGGVRVEVRSLAQQNHIINITGGAVAQVLGLAGKGFSYVAVENLSAGMSMAAVARYSPYIGGFENVESIINRQREEIDALNLLTSKLAYEIEQMKAAANV
ncbi:hypothetical protein ABE562_04890 [Brucella intermedia]|uniref:Uncharacterized protein n=1 Tax=Brucella intermedia GD04153 TaxID=2975438 RepID=A0AA42GW89_9HYPH|nr:hypothetical protein [Brucella intermedia]MDH0123302.1 hypothetical protein [Brucella intermedia GD04153]